MEELIVEVIEEITPDAVDLIVIEIERHGGHQGKRHAHLVIVTIDTHPKQLRPGRYLISVLKRALGVDPSYELEQLQAGKLVPLSDDAHIHIKGGESFVSHVRSGASS